MRNMDLLSPKQGKDKGSLRMNVFKLYEARRLARIIEAFLFRHAWSTQSTAAWEYREIGGISRR